MSAAVIDFAAAKAEREKRVCEEVDESCPKFLCYLDALKWQARRARKQYPRYFDVVAKYAAASPEEREAVCAPFRAHNAAVSGYAG